MADEWEDIPVSDEWEDVPVGSEPKEETWKDRLLSGAVAVANKVDSYTGAPTRSAIGALQKDLTDLPGAAASFKKQFGSDPSTAPSGQQLVEETGVPRTAMSEYLPSLYSETGDEWLKMKKGGIGDPTASGVAGLGIDMTADPSALIPVGKLAQIAKKALKSKAGLKVGSGVLKGSAKVAEAFTGVPARETETYVRKFDDVNKMAKKYGGDAAAAADDIRKKMAGDIASTRKAKNAAISAEKTALPPMPKMNAQKVVDSMEAVKSRLNPKFDADQIKEIDDLIKKVKEAAPDMNVDIGDAYDMKRWLQDVASGSYKKDGQIFIPGTQSAAAAKAGAAEARKLSHVSQSIAGADNDLSLLRNIEKNMNRNLIAPGKPEGALIAAGSGNNRSRGVLGSLGRLTGTDMVGEVDKLAAMKRFAKPELLPVDSTGKSFTRVVAARAALGAGVAGAAGENPLYGLALSSPAALKTAIQAGKGASKFAGAVGRAAASPIAKGAYVAGMGAARSSQNEERTPGQSPALSRQQVMEKLKGTKFEAPLQAAAQRGENAYGVTYYQLHQMSPEFREHMDKEAADK